MESFESHSTIDPSFGSADDQFLVFNSSPFKVYHPLSPLWKDLMCVFDATWKLRKLYVGGKLRPIQRVALRPSVQNIPQMDWPTFS